MNNYQKINNITGWLSFFIACFVYMTTVEPTASFWDCGEFIATAYGMEVGHPPGAPLFLMVARVCMLFAPDTESLPYMVNLFSALVSAFTILFLFWTITHFTKKVIASGNEMTASHMMVIIGSGFIGAMAYTFSDSFWFSAVEGEVYATSSLFTAIVFWAILKWENVADEKHADRWIILIAYLIGLSIGVHLLNLLAIPAIGLVYYFRKYKPTLNGVIIAGLISVIVLGVIQAGIIPGVVNLAFVFDRFFVNSLGFSFGSGVIFYAMISVALLVWGLYYTRINSKPIAHTALLCLSFILIGYTSFAQILIRSAVNPPIDENNPENVVNFLSYLNREQYGDRPLLFGQYYTARVVDYEKKGKNYIKGKEKYVTTSDKIEPVFEPGHTTLFPRMYSSQASHVSAYKEWGEVKGDKKPSMGNNVKYFISYQIGHMYWRYFMWNFAGRQNDIQGHGSIVEGNWISGIPAIDEQRLGRQDTLPKSMTDNKAMNKLYFLPLIFGLIGLFWHFARNNKDASVVMLMFFLTGLAIIIYLNQTPYQPRERDYAYAASFYTFAIWIGMSVAGLYDLARSFVMKDLGKVVIGGVSMSVFFYLFELLASDAHPVSMVLGYFTIVLLGLFAIVIGVNSFRNEKLTAGIAIALALVVPGIMAAEEWDDHNRANRYTARDFASDYLNSCAPNAILFTNGDNDTFPLWYAQEVEGIRRDVRVVNLSLLNTDWYIDQMKRKAYESDPIPLNMPSESYIQGVRDYVLFSDRNIKGHVDLKEVMSFITSDDPRAKAQSGGGEFVNYYPTKKFSLPVDAEIVLKNKTVPAELAPLIPKSIEWEIDKGVLMKADIAILDMLAANNWRRPVYFAITVSNDAYLGLEQYFQLEGLAYRITPIKNPRPEGQPGRVHTGLMYENLMNKFKWGNMADPRVYLDENNQRMTMNLRNNFGRLAEALLVEGKVDSAVKALDRCLEVMPDPLVPYNFFMLRIAELYYKIGSYQNFTNLQDTVRTIPETKLPNNNSMKANTIVRKLREIYEDNFNYYASLKGTKNFKTVEQDMQQSIAVVQELLRMAREAKQDDLVKELEAVFKRMETEWGRM